MTSHLSKEQLLDYLHSVCKISDNDLLEHFQKTYWCGKWSSKGAMVKEAKAMGTMSFWLIHEQELQGIINYEELHLLVNKHQDGSESDESDNELSPHSESDEPEESDNEPSEDCESKDNPESDDSQSDESDNESSPDSEGNDDGETKTDGVHSNDLFQRFKERVQQDYEIDHETLLNMVCLLQASYPSKEAFEAKMDETYDIEGCDLVQLYKNLYDAYDGARNV